MRAAYAEVMTDALTGDGTKTVSVKLTQKQNDWQDTSIEKIGDKAASSISVTAGKTITVAYDSTSSEVTFTSN